MSFDYSGSFSGSFTGNIISTNGVISSSAQLPSGILSSSAQLPSGVVSSSAQITVGSGFISSSTQVNYNSITNRPTTISAFQKNAIVANNQFREVTYPATSASVSTRLTDLEDAGYLTSASAAAQGFGSGGDTNTDSQTLTFDDTTNALSISGGNSVDLSTLAGGGGEGGGTNITASDEGSALSKVVRSFDFVGNAVTATNSGNAVTVTVNTGSLKSGLISGSSQVSFDSITGVPSSLVSSSAQIADDISGSLSSTAIAGLGAGIISSSTQIDSNFFNIDGLVSSSAQIADDISGSLSNTAIAALGGNIVSSSTQISGLGFVTNANTSSFLVNSDTASFITNADTASFLVNSDTASFITNSDTASFITNADTASFIINSQTSSFIQTMSFDSGNNSLSIQGGNSVDLSSLSGGGGGSGLALTASDEGSNLSENVRSLDFVGNAVVATNSGNSITVTVNTGSLKSGIISSSAQIADDISGSFVQASASFSTRVTANDAKVGYTDSAVTSVIHSESVISSSAQIASDISGSLSATAIANLGAGIVSSSNQILPIATSSITNFDTEVSRSAAASGFGTGGGGSTDITALNNFTGSANTSITSLNTFTGSAISNNQTSSMSVATSSFVQAFSIFDGNRIVSNTNFETGIYNNNFGTSGSLTEFIEKVFFPNTAPSISGSFFKVEEFEASGSSIGTISATDAEGQTITFRTQSSYTADLFKIHSGSGEITINVKTTASINDTSTPLSIKNPASSSHEFLVEAEDTFGGTSEATIYIHVNPNQAPVWRETSVNGAVTTEFTHSLNESSAAGNNKVRVFVSDYEGDTITIGTGSLPSDFTDAFSLTVAGTYVQLNQTTSSLDYENITGYNIVLTASDQHYESGDDTEAIAYLPFHVRVVDNVGPTVNNQTLGGVNENSSNGASAGTISATDSEGNSIIYSNFTLVEANLDGGSNITSSLGGNSLYDPHQDPFQVNANSGEVTRKNGVYLNSDVANNYIYRVTVNDAFNSLNDTGLITIPIADDAASTVQDNWTNVYIIESARDGDSLRIGTNGRTGTIAQWSAATSQRWEVSSENDLIEVTSLTGSTTQLRVKNDVSGSLNSFDGDDRISVRLTASEHGFETTKQFVDLDVRVAINNSPSITFTNTGGNLNTNGARSGSTLTTISFTDAEGDTLSHDNFVFTDPSGQLNAYKSGDTYLVQSLNNLSGSVVYGFTASIKDEHGFRTTTENHSITIAQAGIGTLGGDTTSHIIESALSGSVLRDATGFNAGNPSQLTVSYSPQYNSAAVQSFTSSNAAIAIDNSGNLTIAEHVSGSSSGSGDTYSTDITYRDQFDNIGSGSVTVNVFANEAPSATFSDVTANQTASVAASTNLINITITDTESDTPFSASLSGAGASSLKLIPQNANSSSYQLQSSTTISSATTLNYTASIFDNFDKTRNYNRTLTIAAEPVLVYGYGWDGGSAANEATAIASMGDSGADEVAITSGSVISHLQSGSLGSTFNPTYVGGTMTLHSSSSLGTMSDSNSTGISTLGYFNFSGTSQRLLIIFASSSLQGGKPASMYDGVPPDSSPTANEYYVYAKDAAIPGTIGTGIYYFDTENPVSGVSRWGMIFAEGENTNNSRYYLMPDSASAP